MSLCVDYLGSLIYSPAVPTPGYEIKILELYKHNLKIALPLTILAIKLLVRQTAREPAKDIYRSLLTLPLDFIYISIGILLAALARTIPAFLALYDSDTDVDFGGAILLAGLISAAVIVTWLARLLRYFWQKFYAAWRLLDEGAQYGLEVNKDVAASNTLVSNRQIVFFWVFVYWTLMMPVLLGEIVLSMLCLGGILRRIS